MTSLVMTARRSFHWNDQMGGILVQQRLFHGDVLCTAA